MDRISGLVIFFLGMAILWQGRHLSLGSVHSPGAGFFPTLLAVLLMILSLYLIIPARKGEGEGTFSIKFAGRLIMVFLALLAYSFFLEILGFILVSFLLMILLFVAIARQRWPIAALWSFIFTGLSYVLFQVLLKSNFPKGVLGF